MKVLLLTNFSDYAKNGVEYAMALFKHEQVDYFLLNTYTEPYSSANVLISIRDILAKQSEEELADQAKAIRRMMITQGQTLTIRSEYGALIPIATKLIHEENIDLVVMGTQGGEGGIKLFWGSNTAPVARKINCPILIIPGHYKYKPINQIALAIEHTSLNSIETLTPVLKLNEREHSQLLVVNVLSAEDKAEVEQADEKMKGILGNTPYHFYHTENKNVVRGLNNFIDEMKVDLLALVGGHYNQITDLFHKSITKKIAVSSNIPVMVLHDDSDINHKY